MKMSPRQHREANTTALALLGVPCVAILLLLVWLCGGFALPTTADTD